MTSLLLDIEFKCIITWLLLYMELLELFSVTSLQSCFILLLAMLTLPTGLACLHYVGFRTLMSFPGSVLVCISITGYFY